MAEYGKTQNRFFAPYAINCGGGKCQNRKKYDADKHMKQKKIYEETFS